MKTGFLITIPIRNIVNPNHYPEVREAAENLAKSLIRIVQVNKESGQRVMRSLTLFGAVVTPMDKQRNSELKIEMSKEVSRLLVEMDINKARMPSSYTSFDLQVVTRAKNKYTPRIKLVPGVTQRMKLAVKTFVYNWQFDQLIKLKLRWIWKRL